MLILLGPDGSGKSTLAQRLGMPVYHFTKDSKYEDYLKPLCSLEMYNAVLDRHILCEYPYSKVMGRKFQFTPKQWQNIVLLTFIQKPLIILCTHRPERHEYNKEQYLPYDKWDTCLSLYEIMLSGHHIPCIEYDYAGPVTPTALKILHDKYVHTMDWWKPMWEKGYGCIGSPQPKILLVAERIGPNNVNNLPFETGPTGQMLTDMLERTKTPLWDFAVTNMVKSYRKDTRYPNRLDTEFLRLELEELKPKVVVLMGTPAKRGIKTVTDKGIPHHEVVHFGFYNYRKDKNVEELHNRWRGILEEVHSEV